VISQIFYVAKDLTTPATLHANAVGTSVHLKQVAKIQYLDLVQKPAPLLTIR